MKFKLPEWFKKEIKIPVKPRRVPSAWELRIFKGFRALFLLLLICFVIWRVQLYCELNQRFKVIRDANLPTSGQELTNWRRAVPDAENAALVLTQAFALLRNFPDQRSSEVSAPSLLDRRVLWRAETRKLAAEYVTMNVDALAKSHEAILHPQCCYAADFSYGPGTELPHLGKLKDLARVVALQSILDADAGHSNEWPEGVQLILRLAATLDDEPMLISHLVRNSILRMGVRTTEHNLNLFCPGEETCRKLGDAFANAEKTNSLPLALTGERALLAPAFRLSWSEIQHLSKTDEDALPGREPQRFSGKPNPILWLTGFFERDLNFFLQVMETNISMAALSPPTSLTFTNVSEQLREMAQRRHYIFSGMLLPAYSRVVVREAEAYAHIRIAIAALGVERFRLVHGRLPDNLGEIMPQFFSAVPDDPFDGKPLRYHRLEKGYVVYSIGSDGHDDGGREKPADWKSRDETPYDLTFVVER